MGVLNVKVRKVVEADIKALQNWQLDAAGRGSSLYYVTMTVANVGDQDLSGQRIPLYVLDGANALVESSAFKKEFKPCPSPALPDGFVTGEKVTVCQAYLVPKRGEVDAVTFRPTEKFNPITWVGKVTEPEKPEEVALRWLRRDEVPSRNQRRGISRRDRVVATMARCPPRRCRPR